MPAYLEIPGMLSKGSALKVELLGVNTSVGSPYSGGVSGNGGLKSSEVVVTRKTDRYSSDLMREAYQGQPRPMTIYLTDRSGPTVKTYLTLKMQNCMITSYSVSSGEESIETMSINYEKAEYLTDPI